MADTPTAKLGLFRPKLGKKPWKREWDFNMALLDDRVGGILDGTHTVGRAAALEPTGLIEAIIEITGSLSPTSFPNATSTDVEIDHTSTAVFALPAQPIFLATGGVKIIPLADRTALSTNDYGGKFRVRVENNSGGTVAGSAITWARRGIRT